MNNEAALTGYSIGIDVLRVPAGIFGYSGIILHANKGNSDIPEPWFLRWSPVGKFLSKPIIVDEIASQGGKGRET